MNNKGFTLIEILVVITIIVTLGIVVTISLSDTLEKSRQKSCDEFVSQIEEAACVYVGLSKNTVPCNQSTGGCTISVGLLYNEGLIDKDEDICTGNNIDLSKTVRVSFSANGEKKCEYNGVKVYER